MFRHLRLGLRGGIAVSILVLSWSACPPGWPCALCLLHQRLAPPIGPRPGRGFGIRGGRADVGVTDGLSALARLCFNRLWLVWAPDRLVIWRWADGFAVS